MKLSYAIENIRRIIDFEEIEMRPITVLVGRNSAGKSTFLRSFPLIRQSLETRSSAPILWYGDLVDFGDANVAIAESQTERQAAFRFTLRDLTGRTRQHFHHSYEYRRPSLIEIDRVSVRYVIGAREESTVLKRLEIQIPTEEISVRITFASGKRNEGNIRIDDLPADFIKKTQILRRNNRSIFSSLRLIPRTSEDEENSLGSIRKDDFLARELESTFRSRITRNLRPQTIRKEAIKVLSSNRLDETRIIELIDRSATSTFREIYEHLQSNETSEFKRRVFAIQKLSRVFDVLDVVEENLNEYFLGIRYLEPVRAASERFYRKQELEVSEIAPNGSNFPIFLASLASKELDQFSRWIEGIFGYRVEVRRTGGHISLHLRSGDKSVNVTDTGYGVSQILPVLGLIWWAQHGPRKRLGRFYRAKFETLAIEQPELHLHPAHQAKLADAFVAAIHSKDSGRSKPQISIIVETHSEALVHRLGELVELGRINASDVQIVIFSAADDLDSPTEISVSNFDDTGALTNWPFGFFNYSNQ